MGKGKRATFRAIAAYERRRQTEVALVQVGQIAEKIISHPTAAHDFVALKGLLEKLYVNSNLNSAPKDVRESFQSIFKTTSQVVEMAIKEEGKREVSILDRRLRGSSPK